MFDHVYSLGNKCEISYQIKNYLPTFEAGLFSWTYPTDDDMFIEILYHPDCFLNDTIHFIQGTDDLYCFEEHRIWAHGRVPGNRIFDSNGRLINEENYEVAKKELRARFGHLQGKFRKQAKGQGRTLFIKQHLVNNDYEGTVKFLKEMETFFDQSYESGEYCLLLVIEKCQMDACLAACENDHVKVRTLDYFANTEDVFASADKLGWKKIFDEFVLDNEDEKRD